MTRALSPGPYSIPGSRRNFLFPSGRVHVHIHVQQQHQYYHLCVHHLLGRRWADTLVLPLTSSPRIVTHQIVACSVKLTHTLSQALHSLSRAVIISAVFTTLPPTACTYSTVTSRNISLLSSMSVQTVNELHSVRGSPCHREVKHLLKVGGNEPALSRPVA